MKPNIVPGGKRIRPKSLKRDWMARMASRVGNIALPSRGYNVFGKLREREFSKYGDFGGANDPRKGMMPADQYLGQQASTGLPNFKEMDQIRATNNGRTRDELIQQSLGMSPLNKMSFLPPKPGVASARFGATVPIGPTGALPTQTGNDAWVDDSNLGLTLAQTVGSGMLSMQQLQNASYANVYSLIKKGANVGWGTPLSEDDHREATYYLQRMILEGYVRGVDLVRTIKDNFPNGQMPLGIGHIGNAGGWGGTNGAEIDRGLWDGVSDVTKIMIFYQEVGHALLDWPSVQGHNRGLMNTFYVTQQQDVINNYPTYVDWFFEDADTNRGRPTPGLSTQEVQNIIAQNPDWFPSLSGTDLPPTVGQPPGTPPGTPPTVNVDVPINMYTINPTTVTPGQATTTPMGGGDGGSSTPDSAHNTPVAGALPDMQSVRTFAAGLQEATSKASPMLNNLAGALTKFKSG